MWRAVQGDLGRSLQNNIPVATQIMLRLPWTIELAVMAMFLTMFFGIGLGMVAALRHNTFLDTLAMILALIGISLPVYWSSILLIIVFAVNLQILPAIGQGGFERLIMPAFALALVSAGSLARMVRSSMLEVLNQDYVLTARSKGLSEQAVVGRHALRNALIPVVTILGLTFGNLLGGAVITETIFARLGIGQMYVEAVLQKDFTLVQGTTLFIALSYVLINILTDVLYVVIDPRIRYE
jgi:peptide/nickel transport system permease protein